MADPDWGTLTTNEYEADAVFGEMLTLDCAPPLEGEALMFAWSITSPPTLRVPEIVPGTSTTLCANRPIPAAEVKTAAAAETRPRVQDIEIPLHPLGEMWIDVVCPCYLP